MMKATDQEIELAAEEIAQKFGQRAAMEAALWSNDAMEKGNTADYEFWQRVAMKITALILAKPRPS